MPHPGQRTRRVSQYDASTGQNYRTGTVFTPDLAVKAIRAAELLNMSLNGYINELVRRDQVDENGRPVWGVAPDSVSELPIDLAS